MGNTQRYEVVLKKRLDFFFRGLYFKKYIKRKKREEKEDEKKEKEKIIR